METVLARHVAGGVLDISTTQFPKHDDIEIEVQGTMPSVVVKNAHVLGATRITIGSNLSYSLSAPIELPQSTVSYNGPVIDKMVLPAGLKSLTVVETPKSVVLSKIRLPAGLESLEVRMTETFSPVDEIDLPPALLTLGIFGEHNCSIELLRIPPTVTRIDLGSSVQPVDRIQANLLDMQVKSRSTRLVEVEEGPRDSQFSDHLILSSSLPIVSEIHKYVPKLGNLSVILDQTMWSTVGDIWCKTLLEGGVQVESLTVVNNTGKRCMGDFGEVLYRSKRLGRTLCKHLRVIGEEFDYATALQVTQSVRTLPFDIQVDVDFVAQLPKCALHRMASVLGAAHRDEALAYHSMDTNVSLDVGDNKVVFIKSVSRPAEEQDDTASDVGSDFSDLDVKAKAGSSNLHSPFEEKTEKPIVLYSWKDCGFCRKQDAVIENILQSPEAADKFRKCVAVKNLDNPGDAEDKRVKAFPTWVVRGDLVPGFKQEEEVLGMLRMV